MHSKQENIISLGFAMILGLYCISFLWNFWSYGYTTLGIGAAFFGLLTLGFFIFSQQKDLTVKSLSWIIPLALIILSIGIYTNPFIKVINIILIPFLYLIFTTHETKKAVREALWSKLFLSEYLAASLRVIGWFFKSIPAIGKLTQKEINAKPKESAAQGKILSISSQKTHTAYKQITIGLGIFTILAVTIVIPLLSSADPRFATLFEKIIDYFISFVSLEGLVKALFIIGVSCTFFGYRLYWQRKYKPFVEITQQADIRSYSPMIGTILLGLLGLYGLFLFLQATNLFANSLPSDFKVTETLVKSGFWQLLVLTALNTVLYTTIFGKTIRWVQYILGAFTIASLLLLFSAVQRVYLYVTVYGLSYEKFFAFYTVLFCVSMFVWFIYLMITKKKDMPIFKTLCFSALWLYAAITVFPVERFVLTTNLAMTKSEESRIDLNELQMLSFDAVKTFDNKKQEIIAESEKDKQKAIELLREQKPGIYLAKQNENTASQWSQWKEEMIEKKEYLNCYYCAQDDKKNKKWHEKTLTEILYPKSTQKITNEDDETTWRDPYNGYQLTYKDQSISSPYSYPELTTQSTFEVSQVRRTDAAFDTALSIERFYFEDFDIKDQYPQYLIENKSTSINSREDYEALLIDSPTFQLENVVVRPLIPSENEKNIVLYIDAPKGYFVLTPENLFSISGTTPQTVLPKNFDEYIKLSGMSIALKDLVNSFTLIEQKL